MVNPVTVNDAFALFVRNGAPVTEGDGVTKYSIIGEPPVDVGGTQVKVACVFPVTAVTPVGADGATPGTPTADVVPALAPAWLIVEILKR